MKRGWLVMGGLMAGCAAMPNRAQEIVRHQTMRLEGGAEATLRVDCPPGELGVSARHKTNGLFVVTESRSAEQGVWWVSFANPTHVPLVEEVSIRLTCK